MKVLLSFVGEQDPYSDKTGEEGSIVTLCRYLKPELIYLFPTASGFNIRSETQTRAMETETWIKSEIEKNCQIFIKPLQLSDPTDYSLILPQARQAVATVLKELSQTECEFHLNCSSGTPQLKSVWLILANSGVIRNCQLWQIANPKFSKDLRVRKLEVTFLEEENILARVKKYSQEFLFQRIAEECERLQEISLYSYRKEKAGLVARIFKAYQYWDLIKYDEAYRKLFSVYCNDVRSALDLSDLAEIVKSQVEVLAKLKDNSAAENEYNLIDMYFNAWRRKIRGDFTDTLARFWRIYEGALYMHLRSTYKIEPRDLTQSVDKKRAETVAKSIANSGWVKGLSIVSASKTLEEVFHDKIYRKLSEKMIPVKRGSSKQNMKVSDVLNELRERRNESIVAHGMRPVAEDDAVNALIAADALLRELIPGAHELLDDYPLGLEKILKVLETLDRSFAL